MRGTMLAGAAVLALVVANGLAVAQEQPLDKGEFVKKTTQANYMEIVLGKLAMERAESPQVKQFAQEIVKDHSQAQAQLLKTFTDQRAQRPELDRQFQERVQKLNDLKGKEFDQEYLKLMVEEHRKGVDLFEKAAKGAQDDQVKDFANQALPKLREHLKQAEQLQGNINK